MLLFKLSSVVFPISFSGGRPDQTPSPIQQCHFGQVGAFPKYLGQLCYSDHLLGSFCHKAIDLPVLF